MPCSISPGKVILFGEHFVVKGEPALGLAVSLYAKVCVEYGSGKIYSKNLGVIEKDSPHYPLFNRIMTTIDKRYGLAKPVDIVIESSIPVSSGMGSSAAVAVATTSSLLELIGVSYTRRDIWEIAHEAEKAVHVNPSGVDTTLSTYGGLLLYRAGEFKRIELSLPKNVSLVIVNTGIQRNTGVVVREVLELKERLGVVGDYVYKAAGSIIDKALEAIKASDPHALAILMLVNHGLLWAMGVSCRKCDDIIYELLDSGALGAKISGAGRGGIIIALVEKSRVNEVFERLSKRYEIYIAEPDYHGVRVL